MSPAEQTVGLGLALEGWGICFLLPWGLWDEVPVQRQTKLRESQRQREGTDCSLPPRNTDIH